MQGPFADEYWRAMATEMETLEVEMQSWEVVRRTSEMNVFPSTWAFKCKEVQGSVLRSQQSPEGGR